MIRLIQIEWFKLRHYRPFWILVGMFVVLSTAICSSLMGLMTYFKNQGANFRGIADPTMIPLYDFPDIWQNITYIAAILKIILAFIIVMSIYNEINQFNPWLDLFASRCNRICLYQFAIYWRLFFGCLHLYDFCNDVSFVDSKRGISYRWFAHVHAYV